MDNFLENKGLANILNHLTDGIIVTSPEGIVLFCNDAAVVNYGVSKTKLLAAPIDFLAESSIIDQSFRDLAISTKKPITYEQICNSRKHLLNKTIPVLDKNNQVKYILEQTYSIKELVFHSSDQILDAPVFNQAVQMKQNDEDGIPLTEFKSKAMEEVYSLADNMASKNINILILGGSGTGKSQLAKRIHSNSKRKNGPFVTINCSTIPENLLESELFGYVKGAFSGASDRGKQGLVELADGGTLFLDEIGEMSLNTQTKMLQLVQDKTYLPIGGVHRKQVDTRIIAATNKDLFQQVKDKAFRKDLYYRLAVVTITMPPLKNRPDDIRQLIHHFTHLFNHKHHTDVTFSHNTIDLLVRYPWPGNIRELEHLVEFLILNANEDYVMPHMLPSNIQNPKQIYPLESDSDIADFETGSAASRKPSLDEKNAFALPEDAEGFDSLESFLDYCEGAFVKELYASYNSSYKLAERLKISQSKASRLMRKHLK